MKSLLTVPIQAPSIAMIEQQLRKNEKNAQVYEIWIDHLPAKELSVEHLRESMKKWKKMSKKKLLVVCKNLSEKGKFRGRMKEKAELLLAAVEGGADYVDVEVRMEKKLIQSIVSAKKKKQVIVSFHDFKRTPSVAQLKTLVAKMAQMKADILKIVTFVKTLEDNQNLINLALELKHKKQKHIILGMGEKGIVTRILGQKLGNELDFVSLDSRTAAGQLSLEQANAFHAVLH